MYKRISKIFQVSEGDYWWQSKNCFRRCKLCKVTWWRLVVHAKELRLGWCHHKQNAFIFSSPVAMPQVLFPRYVDGLIDLCVEQLLRISQVYKMLLQFLWSLYYVSCSKQILQSLSAWLKGTAVLQCLGWQLFVCKYLAAHFRSVGHSEEDLSVCMIDRLWTVDGSGPWVPRSSGVWTYNWTPYHHLAKPCPVLTTTKHLGDYLLAGCLLSKCNYYLCW